MIGARIEFEMVLVAETGLHIGSGDFLDAVASDPPKRSSAKIAAVMRDWKDRPYIPGSTLKGCLRALLGETSIIFGDKVSASSDHKAGQVIFCDAFMLSDEGDLVTTSSNVAIDDEAGVALKARLFTREIVYPGACFSLKLVSPAHPTNELSNAIARLLQVLVFGEGITLGKGTRQALGRLRVDRKSFRANCVAPGSADPTDVTDHWAALARAQVTSAAPTIGAKVRLSSRSPFLISDPANAPEKGDKTTPQIVGLADENGMPELTGATFLGALRARTAWHEALQDPDAWDNRDRVLRPNESADGLTRTQRLFGVTGWRGQVSIKRISLVNRPHKQRVTSVRIDRFSAAPVDNALYTFEAWLAPEYEVSLRFDPRSSPQADEDWAFFKSVLREVSDDVWGELDLGLGKTRGFGTFDVEVTFD